MKLRSKNMTTMQQTDTTAQDFRENNSITVLKHGDEIFPAMLEAIRGARESVELCTYVYWRGEIAHQMAEALIERAKAGIQTRLLLDALGCFKIEKELVQKMEEAGVQVARFRPPTWFGLHRLNYRTHRKILVVDGHIGFTGGVGIAEEWTGNAQDPEHWRDTHCRIDGPACIDLQLGFAENWTEATGEELVLNERSLKPQGTISIQTTLSGAGKGSPSAEKLVLDIFDAATKRLWITSAYFVPTGIVRKSLMRAVARGVDVRILTNGRYGNHQVTRWAGHVSYTPLLRNSIRLYEYDATVLHAKVITIDNNWSLLGSVNIDNRSLALNDEIAISFKDADITQLLDMHFEDDLKHSTEIKLQYWLERGYHKKALMYFSGLFRRQL
jgi:cardiolipin synthase